MYANSRNDVCIFYQAVCNTLFLVTTPDLSRNKYKYRLI